MLQYQKKQVKREVKWNLIGMTSKADLVLLKFTESEKQTKLRWEHSKEFEYMGQMYDIVSTEIIGDTTYYWVWWDHAETKLNKQLDELLDVALGSHPERHQSQDKLMRFYKSLFWNIDSVKQHSARSEIVVAFPRDIFSCLTFSFSPKVPPPELA